HSPRNLPLPSYYSDPTVYVNLSPLPTRRSSDLPARPDTETAGVEVAGRRIDFARREAKLPGGRTVQLTEREAEVLAFLAANRTRDRKSTRLNSSHVKSSYAVFCSKKKRLIHALA